MKVSLKLLFMTVLISSYALQAMNEDQPNAIKIRGSAFIPQSKRFRDIYGKAAGNIELEYVRYLCEHLSFWVNMDGLAKRGHSIGFCNPTKIGIFNFSFGLDFPWEICDRSTLYFGFGPSFGAVHINNDSICCCEKVTKGAVGVVIKTGLDICLSEHAFIEIFVDYLYERAFFHDRIDVSGLKPGVAFGIKF